MMVPTQGTVNMVSSTVRAGLTPTPGWHARQVLAEHTPTKEELERQLLLANTSSSTDVPPHIMALQEMHLIHPKHRDNLIRTCGGTLNLSRPGLQPPIVSSGGVSTIQKLEITQGEAKGNHFGTLQAQKVLCSKLGLPLQA